MRIHQKNKSVGYWVATLSGVLLLLISPCKVRHFIQDELGIAKTEVLNKSQTTLSSSSCVISTQVAVKSITSQVWVVPGILSAAIVELVVKIQGAPLFRKVVKKGDRVPTVALYILFQNLQLDL